MATLAEIEASLRPHLVGPAAAAMARKIKDATDAVDARVDTLDTWGGTLATKLNADAGVTDTDYAAPAA